MGTKKRQNKIWEYREMLLAWREQKVDDLGRLYPRLSRPIRPRSIARDIELIKRELPIDILEFFCPHSAAGLGGPQEPDAEGVPMDPDMNNYDLEHVCTGHPLMSPQEWQRRLPQRLVALLHRRPCGDLAPARRAPAASNSKKVFRCSCSSSGATRIEGVHPLQFGVLRRKVRTQRRFGMPVESPLVFYPRRAVEIAGVAWQWFWLMRRYRAIMNKVAADPNATTYTDQALTATAAAEDDFVQAFADKIPDTYGAPAIR